uniref:Uncharacterized protein n=1 Tax=Microcebus murinus TaxID=30608 RepID=A0A8C5Y255_MICMU
MAWTLSLILIMVVLLSSLPSGSCALWVSQPPEIHAQCSFNAGRGRLAIGSIICFRDKVAPGKEVRNETPEFRGCLAELYIWDTRGLDAGVCAYSVEVLGGVSGWGTGLGWGCLFSNVPGNQGSSPEAPLRASTALLLRAGLCAFSLLSVAMGSTLSYQRKCDLTRSAPRRELPRPAG